MISFVIICGASGFFLFGKSHSLFDQEIDRSNLGGNVTAIAKKRSYEVQIQTLGELEAAHTIRVASLVRGDLGKIIYLIEDGKSVNIGDVLVKMDPTPFEEMISEQTRKIKDKENCIQAQKHSLEQEKIQVEQEIKSAEIEREVAALEHSKLISGDGPFEIGRLTSAMQKAHMKYTEVQGYIQDLLELQEQNFFNLAEIKQAEKKLKEEEEAFLSAKSQHDSYVDHVYPMLLKKSEINLKRSENTIEEAKRLADYKILSTEVQLALAEQELNDLKAQLNQTIAQMELTEIRAQAPGMVVHKEDYRNGQRRKPRLGDVIVKNQTILDLPDLSAMIVKTKVKEIDLFKIQEGTPVTIEVDAYPDLHFSGQISMIGVLAVVDYLRSGDEKYFEVTIAMNHTDPRLRPGMTARAFIHAKSVENQLCVPIQAIFEFNRQHYCYLLEHRRCRLQPVRIGCSNEQWVEILSGLNENDEVLLISPDINEVENAHEVVGI